jgi:hypothetical protein
LNVTVHIPKTGVTPDTAHLIGNYWQIKTDGVLRGNFLLLDQLEWRRAEAKKLIDWQEE